MAEQGILGQALSVERVRFLGVDSKREALDLLVDVLASSPAVSDRAALADAVWRREALMSTGIGFGIGVPHVRLASVSELVMAAGVCVGGIDDYQSLDDHPVHLVFMIAARPDQHAEHLRLLSAISTRMKTPGLRDALSRTVEPRAFRDVLTGAGEPRSRPGGE